jgi:protein-disulfide isomerase
MALVVSVLLAWLLLPPQHIGEGASALPTDGGRSRGNPTAPITLVEYSDFTCGFCVKFFRETWPRLNAKYVERGLVRFVYRDFPRAVQGPGLQAAVAARCAGEQGRYWQMHDRLFSSDLRTAALDRYAVEIGLDRQAFVACLNEGRYVAAVLRDRQEGEALGFRGTPGFVLVRTNAAETERRLAIPGAFPFEVFEQQIQRLLSSPKEKG